ncbi:hypothetical protein F5050DRAFT_1761534 [Lentinula boryana]|uniref:Uncharacterized protein n=1 Tax=Lentinula boryana TaxID=40481 RepID=A0ABQ8QCB9_9AGAR|nr:hypothetical protein F5050DRAFT_1761534 [Lentinula boryana]
MRHRYHVHPTRVQIDSATYMYRPTSSFQTQRRTLHIKHLAFVLELRSKFPSSSPRAPTSDGSWKTHALNLENELKVLKEKHEEEEAGQWSDFMQLTTLY